MARSISTQRDTAGLSATILEQACRLSAAQATLLWLYRDAAEHEWLDGVGWCQIDADTGQVTVSTLEGVLLPLDEAGQADRPAARVARSGKALFIDASSCPVQVDRRDLALLTPRVGRVESLYLVPLCNHEGVVLAVVQLVNLPRDKVHEVLPQSVPEPVQLRLSALSAYAGVALSNLWVGQDLKALLDAFVKVIARAVDAKSPHTSAHCQRVPLLTELLARAACEDQAEFADFDLDDDGWYELQVAAWLHDCGKLATPDSVLDKATKLQTLHDRIDVVRTRFAVLRSDVERRYQRATLTTPEREPQHRAEMERDVAALIDDLAFLERINKGSEAMADADQQRVQAIARRRWTDVQGQSQPLLSDDETENLCIVRGTLTEAERQIINGHMDVTLDMLEFLPFPRKLRRVPEYAGGHHERMDGSGFPRGLTREQMSVPARIMAIADVFEALTAHERPYKAPLRLSEALTIMRTMRDEQHLDPDLYRLFLRSGVWREYGRQALDPEQLDVEDASPYY